jgi:hypothetical protein
MKRLKLYPGDRRRKYSHWQVIIGYSHREMFGRVYTDRHRAEKFAARQERSPVVQSTRIERIS